MRKIAILNRWKVKKNSIDKLFILCTRLLIVECSNFKGQCIISVHYFILDRAHILEENILVFSKSNKKIIFL